MNILFKEINYNYLINILDKNIKDSNFINIIFKLFKDNNTPLNISERVE